MKVLWIFAFIVAIIGGYRILRANKKPKSRATGGGRAKKKTMSDISATISSLQETNRSILVQSGSTPIETFLRLPLLLQKNGQYADAFTEFERLISIVPAKIAKEFAHISIREQNSLIAMERATIFDKMRLAAQRENQFDSAVYFQILSFAYRALGLKLQERDEEFDGFNSHDFWHSRIDSLLKKAQKESCATALVEKCTIYIQGCTASSLTRLTLEISTILEINGTKENAQQGVAPYVAQGAPSGER